MKDDKAKEIDDLAREYEGTDEESPSVMGAGCFGGGGATTGKSPGCSDLSDEHTEQ